MSESQYHHIINQLVAILDTLVENFQLVSQNGTKNHSSSVEEICQISKAIAKVTEAYNLGYESEDEDDD